MADIIRCADRWLREIVLDEDVWYDKIVYTHSEMVGEELAIESCLSDPDFVNFDRRHPHRETFYSRRALSGRHSGRLLKVVVEFQETSMGWTGEVISAFIVFRSSQGERTKWTK